MGMKSAESVKQVLPEFDSSRLMSSKVLVLRSAAPALFARTSKPAFSVKITREEKAKLLRMGKRKVKGLFNTYVGPSEPAPMEVSEAVKNSGQYDAWGAEPDPLTVVLKGKGKFVETEDYLLSLVTKPDVLAIRIYAPLPNPIAVSAVIHPHQGTSYNPLETAYRELLLSAHEVEVRKGAEQAKLTGLKERMEAARNADKNVGIVLCRAGIKPGNMDATAYDKALEEEREGYHREGNKTDLKRKDDESGFRALQNGDAQAQDQDHDPEEACLRDESRQLYAAPADASRDATTDDQLPHARQGKDNSNEKEIGTVRARSVPRKYLAAGVGAKPWTLSTCSRSEGRSS
ncbi:hypothetical protein M422DRAFT_53950 [Sphaerobolus stellatus SS14]|uniref:Ribosome biogenesis protein NOP53 n=1 Tax=Sphaerobolus stellatus (strain SS14) TaxID=990650 RepID=A0A0C9UX65_SPHS4|nr:hypothetical protein M422DRAFT_53950 [Sphaerobolus stellatus SS14]